MRNIEYKRLTNEDIPNMAELLTKRQESESQVFPLLKNNCLNEAFITDRLREILFENKGTGMGSYSNGELVGYILGEPKIDVMRGRHIWVPYEGIAIGMGQSSELIRNLYAAAASCWVELGYFNHYALIPLGDRVYYEAFLGLSFFVDHVHGVMNMADYIPFENVSDAEVRIATETDSEEIGKMYNIINGHQNSAPAFVPAFPERIMAIKEGFKHLVEDDDATVLYGTKETKGLGFQEYEACEANLMNPEKAVELCVAGTYSSHMGNGVGKRLMNEGYRIMKEKGFQAIVSDWRMANLVSSIFWPKCGFKPVAYRMGRFIDGNMAWANYSNPTIKSL